MALSGMNNLLLASKTTLRRVTASEANFSQAFDDWQGRA
jgi:hypothetical protein